MTRVVSKTKTKTGTRSNDSGTTTFVPKEKVKMIGSKIVKSKQDDDDESATSGRRLHSSILTESKQKFVKDLSGERETSTYEKSSTMKKSSQNAEIKREIGQFLNGIDGEFRATYGQFSSQDTDAQHTNGVSGQSTYHQISDTGQTNGHTGATKESRTSNYSAYSSKINIKKDESEAKLIGGKLVKCSIKKEPKIMKSTKIDENDVTDSGFVEESLVSELVNVNTSTRDNGADSFIDSSNHHLENYVIDESGNVSDAFYSNVESTRNVCDLVLDKYVIDESKIISDSYVRSINQAENYYNDESRNYSDSLIDESRNVSESSSYVYSKNKVDEYAIDECKNVSDCFVDESRNVSDSFVCSKDRVKNYVMDESRNVTDSYDYVVDSMMDEKFDSINTYHVIDESIVNTTNVEYSTLMQQPQMETVSDVVETYSDFVEGLNTNVYTQDSCLQQDVNVSNFETRTSSSKYENLIEQTYSNNTEYQDTKIDNTRMTSSKNKIDVNEVVDTSSFVDVYEKNFSKIDRTTIDVEYDSNRYDTRTTYSSDNVVDQTISSYKTDVHVDESLLLLQEQQQQHFDTNVDLVDTRSEQKRSSQIDRSIKESKTTVKEQCICEICTCGGHVNRIL